MQQQQIEFRCVYCRNKFGYSAKYIVKAACSYCSHTADARALSYVVTVIKIALLVGIL